MKIKPSPVILSGLSIAVMALSATSTAVSRPLPEITPASSASQYECYVVTETGRAFDLASMCNGGAGINQQTTNGTNSGVNRAKQSSTETLTPATQSGRLNTRTQIRSASLQSAPTNFARNSYSTNQNARTTRATSPFSNWSYLPERSGDVIGGYAGTSNCSPGSSSGDSSDEASSGGTVQVKGYTRKDGTYVQSHTRSAPGKK